MTIGLKDVLYFVVFAGTISGVWFTFKARIDNAEKAVSLLKKIIFKESGELALITTEACEIKQAAIQKSIDKYDKTLDKVLERLEELSKDVLIIMVHLNIDVETIKDQGVKHG